jgi:hypothetical protein
MAGVSEPLFWPGRVATTLHTIEGHGELAPSILVWMFLFARRLTLVPFDPLVSPSLCVSLIPELCFPWHPQPWPLRKCVGDFEIVSPLSFEYPSATQKVQFVGLGFLGLGQSAAVTVLILLDLDHKVLVSTQVNMGLFLGVLAQLVLDNRAGCDLGEWFGVDWWFMGPMTRVVVVMEGAQ